MKAVIVTAADEKYAPLLRDLLSSIEPHCISLKIDTACLDLGLAPETRDEMSAKVDRLVAPHWPFKPHPVFNNDPRHLSRAARPFMPDLVPGYDVYVWLDADVWAQSATGLQWLVEAALTADIAAAPTLHRAYEFSQRDLSWLFERFRMAHDDDTARKLISLPYVNAGVLAVRAGSPFWRRYAERFQAALDRWKGNFLSDQAVVNATIHLDAVRLQPLPCRVNWLCHLAPPVWDPDTRRLCEPSLPYEPIHIVHNTFDNKAAVVPLRDVNGQPRKTRLTYSAINSLDQLTSQ
jgi:lipopolysaccharide biosynthesis glycosyltransferase